MKHLKIFSLIVISLIATAASCKKNIDPNSDDFYFSCKIDGRLYLPNSCANCTAPKLLGDTMLLINGNAGFETILLGITNKPEVIENTYLLNSNIVNGGTYKNSTLSNDRFDTDSLHIGQLQIISLNKTKRIIQGTFRFKAYNSYRNDSVSITDGRFRLKYTIE